MRMMHASNYFIIYDDIMSLGVSYVNIKKEHNRGDCCY